MIPLFSPDPYASITAEALQTHVKWLSDDARGGRFTPSSGGDASARYIAKHFHNAGASPIVSGDFFQMTGQPGAANVIGIIHGANIKLNEQVLILSAHYDHLGTSKKDVPDRIYNGANDDASGVAGLIVAGRALAQLKPKRSIVLAAFCSEEQGLVGSRWYADHPLVPLKNTVGLIELEQIGRTDDADGERKRTVAITGFRFSSMPSAFVEAAKSLQMRVEDSSHGDEYFDYSDNASLARKGVPAHTVCVAFQFPDYHRPSDTWDKLDYPNMAHVVRLVTASALNIANADERPKWDATNPRTASYREAQAKQGPSARRVGKRSDSYLP